LRQELAGERSFQDALPQPGRTFQVRFDFRFRRLDSRFSTSATICFCSASGGTATLTENHSG
jgi:hypothetical protein